jgi:hypothetical protein
LEWDKRESSETEGVRNVTREYSTDVKNNDAQSTLGTLCRSNSSDNDCTHTIKTPTIPGS